MPLDQISKEEFKSLLKDIIRDAVETHPLSDDEVQWVRMAIQAQADRAALRKAIIEKSLAGLVWAALLASGGYLMDLIGRHWR
jgi:hypothetical protein